MKRRTLLAASLAGLAAALAGCGRKPAAEKAMDSLFAQSFDDTEGKRQELAQWRGKPLLVNFWATWCAPCVEEMPDLDQLSKEFPHVAFVGIGIDSAANIASFIQKVPVSYPLLEAKGEGLELMGKLGNTTGGLPFTVIVGADSRKIRAISGQINADDIRSTLRSVTVSIRPDVTLA